MVVLQEATTENIREVWEMQIKAFAEIEKLHGEDNWSLDTIMQEEGNIYLYEKVGYHQTGEIEHIKDGMDIVFFEKN